MKRDLAQLVFVVGWVLVLWRYQPLRNLLVAAPRATVLSAMTLILVWTWVQVTNQRSTYFPLISVAMYGQHVPATSVSGTALRGRHCDGRSERLDLAFMGRSGIRSRVNGLYDGLAYRRTAADSARRWDLIDRLLLAVARVYNKEHPNQPLCTIQLDLISIPAGQYETGRIPEPTIVRDIPVR